MLVLNAVENVTGGLYWRLAQVSVGPRSCVIAITNLSIESYHVRSAHLLIRYNLMLQGATHSRILSRGLQKSAGSAWEAYIVFTRKAIIYEGSNPSIPITLSLSRERSFVLKDKGR